MCDGENAIGRKEITSQREITIKTKEKNPIRHCP